MTTRRLTKREDEGLRHALAAVEEARAAMARAERLMAAGNAGATMPLTVRRLRLLALLHAAGRPVSRAELARVLRTDIDHLKGDIRALRATTGRRGALVVIAEPGGPPRRHQLVTITDLGVEALARFGAAVDALPD